MHQFVMSWLVKPWPFSWGPFCRRISVLCEDGPDASIVVGLGSTLVPGNSSVNISTRALVPFLPKWIVVSSRIADDFLISDIKVEGISQFVGPDVIPAVLFSSNTVGVRLRMDMVPFNGLFTISVTNQHMYGRNFQGVIIGTEIKS